MEFYNIDPSSWATRQATVINNVEGIYDSQIDIEFDIAGQETWVSDGPLTSTDADTLLNQTRNYWLDRTDQRDLVHLFSGKNLNGGILGAAWQPGIGTVPDYAYSLTQQIAEGSDYQATPYQKKVLAAHELGHNFNGDHAHALSWWELPQGWHYTIMYPYFVGSKMVDYYSDGTIAANKNNVARIRTRAEAYL